MRAPRREASEWAILVGEWRQSGFSLPEFCRRRGLNHKTMSGWIYKRKLRPAGDEAKGKPGNPLVEPTKTEVKSAPLNAFVPVRLTNPTTQTQQITDRSAIQIVLEGNRRITVAPGFDEETLRRVVDALELKS